MKHIPICCAVLATTLAAGAAQAQPYPNRPIRIVVGFAPGGGTDFIARVVAKKLTEQLGTQVIVDNRPGGGSTLGAELVVKSPADGYTLLVNAASYTVNPSVYKLSFDAMNDITPIVQLSRGPYVVAVTPSVPATTLQEFVALARMQPDKFAYASSGNGSHVHVATEYFLRTAGIRVLHVPYKGTGPALADTVAGNTQLILGSVATALQHVKSGRLRALAMTTPKRITAAPDVPTVAEAGYPAYEVTNWHGLVGPKGLPREIVERLNKEVNEALKSKEVEKILASDGLEPAGGSAAQFVPIIAGEIARWREVARQVGLKVE
ncbi:MAG: tripartite tricarboxylate transporter substrate binding protein [Betaproteobacteria bacterium]|nr:tripartite tricarboxylate transporter substrate binding protein [Betaproteobacteria bacterium]